MECITESALRDRSVACVVVFAAHVDRGATEKQMVLFSELPGISEVATKYFLAGEFAANPYDTLLIHAPVAISSERLLVVGLGLLEKATTGDIRRASGAAIRFLLARNIVEAAMLAPHLDTPTAIARAMVEGALLAEYDPHLYRSGRAKRSLASLILVGNEPETMAKGVADGVAIANAQNLARELVNEPPNVLTPTELGRRAGLVLEPLGVKVEVRGEKEMRALGMGAFLAVTRGSSEPPALITAIYDPGDCAANVVLGLVGKGITFDTGGISIKPADGMQLLKADMGGAAAVLGAMRAIAELKLKVKVICVVCAAENMPDGNAFRPGDVITAMTGTTIEVLDTDAEGRLVLADGLAYARQLGATHLLDAATLTGACIVALSDAYAGLFSNSDVETERFLLAAQRSGEAFWRLPCTPPYRAKIASEIADIANTVIPRNGGASVAATFLQEFVGGLPWLHLDIVACAWNGDTQPWIAKGGTGMGVRSICEWARTFVVQESQIV